MKKVLKLEYWQKFVLCNSTLTCVSFLFNQNTWHLCLVKLTAHVKIFMDPAYQYSHGHTMYITLSFFNQASFRIRDVGGKLYNVVKVTRGFSMSTSWNEDDQKYPCQKERWVARHQATLSYLLRGQEMYQIGWRNLNEGKFKLNNYNIIIVHQIISYYLTEERTNCRKFLRS